MALPKNQRIIELEDSIVRVRARLADAEARGSTSYAADQRQSIVYLEGELATEQRRAAHLQADVDALAAQDLARHGDR
jgi:hypothetical protein